MTEEREARLGLHILLAGIGVSLFGMTAVLITQAVPRPTGPIEVGGALEAAAEPLELVAGGWMRGE